MFTSFRNRLLFWFLLFIGINLIIIGLTNAYLVERKKISEIIRTVERVNVLVLKDVKTQQDFFGYETKNDSYFLNGNSKFLNNHKELSESILHNINLISASHNSLTNEEHVRRLRKLVGSTDSIFLKLVKLINVRGYKDFNLEGKMRNHAHWLEDHKVFSSMDILNLRRHEKDYIIRNEQEYVNRFNHLINTLRGTARLSSRKDSSVFHLHAYNESFNKLVHLDQQIGIKANTGLKEQLDSKHASLEAAINDLVVKANGDENTLLQNLTHAYAALVTLLIAGSIILSLILSQKITKPLVALTNYMSRFVESKFSTLEEDLVTHSHDEIGKLTQNFTVMKTEVVNSIKFFKQRVEERTIELAQANERLIKLNEANSRFVPKEFLQFLSKESIEEVMLGDQVEYEMTVMFTDIQSFTKISESLNPQENFDFINGYLREIVPVIRKHNGFIDKYIGDSVMALFPGSPDAALLAALEFEKAVEEFNRYLTNIGREKIVIGSGIHTGRLILGTIGHDHRLETTVISDAVNIASRLEGLTRHYHTAIIASEQTILKLEHPENFYFRYLETVRVKGKSNSVAIYEIHNHSENKIKATYQKEFEFALKLMREKQFESARNIFAELAIRNPEDGALHVLVIRCDEYLNTTLPNEWDGVKVMLTKE